MLKAPRLPWWTLPVAGAITMTLLVVLGVWQLVQTNYLAVVLQQKTVEASIRAEIRPLLDRRDPLALQTAVSHLVRDPNLRLTYVEIVDASNRPLVFDGRPERLRQLGMPDPILATLRDAAYRWSEKLQVVDLGPGARLRVRYLMLRSLPGDVHESALIRLGWSGVLSLFLAIGIGTASAMAWQRTAPISRTWMRRLNQDTAGRLQTVDEDAEAVLGFSSCEVLATQLDEVQRALIVVDGNAIVRLLNHTAARLTGWKPEEALGLPVYSVFHAVDAQLSPQLTPAETCLRDQQAVPAVELHLQARDGSMLPVEVTAIPMRVPSGRVSGASMLFHDIQLREAHVEQWRRQARLSQGVIDHLVEGVLTTDPVGVIRFANARALRMFGYNRNDLDGVSITKLMPVPFLNAPSVRLSDYVAGERSQGLPKVVGWRRDATTFPLELVVQTMTIDQSEGLVLILRDITERMRSENLAQRLGRLLDAASEEVYILDAASLYFIEVNRGARRNLGYHPSEMTRMTPLSISLDLESDVFLNYLARLRSGEVEHIIYRCQHRRADGSSYPVEVRLNYSRDEEPPVFMAIAIDISERERDEHRLRYLAHHDSLTGLPNRATLLDRLSQAVLAARRSNRQVGVLFMDVDRFKSINDSHGHEVGDAVLQQIATRLENLLRATDTVARLGGDEFVVIAPGLRAEQDVLDLARKIHQTFERPLQLPGQTLLISLSVGIALSNGDGDNADQLLHHADLAMYQAKQSGHGRSHLHAAEITPEQRRQRDLDRGLQTALVLNQLHLELLPVFDGATGGLRAAFTRFYWQSPLHRRVSAEETLAAALRAGLKAELELWHLSSAVACMAQRDLADLTLIVPISGWQLRAPDFAEQIDDLVQRHALRPRSLILVTDVEGLRQARLSSPQTLQALHRSGLRLGLFDRIETLAAALAQTPLPALDLLVFDAEAAALAAAGSAAVADLLLRAREANLPLLAMAVADAASLQRLQDQACPLLAGEALKAAMSAVEFAAEYRQQTARAL